MDSEQVLLLNAAIFTGDPGCPRREHRFADGAPDDSGAVDIWFWFAYVVVICAVLFWSVRRRQV